MAPESGRDPAFVPAASSQSSLSRPSGLQSGVGFLPGPWHVDEDDRPGMAWNRHICAGENIRVCFMSNSGDRPFGEANARLIAAAPTLYEALRQCRLELSYCADQLAAHGQTGHPEDSVSRALKAGELALALAAGTRRAETGETLARAEGCQSGPQGNAQ